MSIIINTNISSMQGIRALNKSTGSLNQALERLSTGYRINSSKDDAACCAISASLRKDISSLTVAQSNAQMGQSMIDTANGSLSNISTLLQRMRDLTEQAANGTYGTDERNAMQNEIDNLISEMYRAKESTEFNGKQVLGAETTQRVTEEEAIAQGYKIVKTAKQLQENLTTDADCKVMLFADIDLNDLETVDGSNWTAVGTDGNQFTGTLDGNGFTISNLKINKGDTENQGLIGYAYGATIKNVTLENINVTGGRYTGGLVGRSNSYSKVINCSSSGIVVGNDSRTGGLVGNNNLNSVVDNCSSSVTVTGNNGSAGGLVGANDSNSEVKNSNSYGFVTGNGSHTGGLVGYNNDSTISNCNSTGTVNGRNNVGGIVGFANGQNVIAYCNTLATVYGTSLTNKGAFIGNIEGESTLSGNFYNSTVNDGMRAVGNIATTDEQVQDNKQLVIDPNNPFTKEICAVNLQVGIKDDEFSTIKVDTGFEIGCFNISLMSEYSAQHALDRIDALMSKITNKQTELGAMSNRLMTAMEYQDVQKSANIATNSVIKDADFAKESSNYIKSQILQNTTASLLATANQNPSIALMLVTGTNLNK